MQRDETSVVITCLKKIDSPATYLVNQPMLLRNSSRPHAAKLMLEWLRLTNALEWIFHNILNQKEHAKSYFPVRFHPPSQVLSKLGLECGIPFNWRAQGPAHAAVDRRFLACRCFDLLGAVRSAIVSHSSVSEGDALFPSARPVLRREPTPHPARHAAERSRFPDPSPPCRGPTRGGLASLYTLSR